MKNILIALFLLVVSVSVANSQYLACSTYTSNTEDTTAVSGSTDVQSDNFAANGGSSLWLELHNGAYWYSFEVKYPMIKSVSLLRVAMEGSDSTILVQAQINSEWVTLPVVATSGNSPYSNAIDIGATTRYRIRFRQF